MLGVIVSFTDITAQVQLNEELTRNEGRLSAQLAEGKRVEAELRRGSSLLDRVEEIGSIGYWELDVRAYKVWASKVARSIYGIDEDNIEMPRISACALPEYKEQLRKALDDLIAGKSAYDQEFRIYRSSDGAIRDIRSRAVYLKDEYKVTGVCQDITDVKTVESNLRKLSEAVEQNPASIMITDLAGNIEYVNPKFTELTGYTPDEMIGQNPRVLQSEVTPTETYKEMWRTLSSGRVWNGILYNKKKDGDLYCESASISPIFDRSGQLTHYVAVKEDITQRLNTDVELIALSDRAAKRLEYLQAAHALRIPIGTVRSRLARARLQLHSLLYNYARDYRRA